MNLEKKLRGTVPPCWNTVPEVMLGIFFKKAGMRRILLGKDILKHIPEKDLSMRTHI